MLIFQTLATNASSVGECDVVTYDAGVSAEQQQRFSTPNMHRVPHIMDACVHVFVGIVSLQNGSALAIERSPFPAHVDGSRNLNNNALSCPLYLSRKLLPTYLLVSKYAYLSVCLRIPK